MSRAIPASQVRAAGLRPQPQAASQSSIPIARRIPDTWFRAQASATTMGFIMEACPRTAPLRDGERVLGKFVLPPFQRPPVWTQQQQIRFIESCWMGLPIGAFTYNQPPDFSSQTDMWLLDGQQRITAVYAYLAGEFPVLGYRYSELTVVDHRKWHMGVSFPALITSLTDEGELREIYDRLAYGGTAHEPAQGTSGSAQDRNGLDPKGAGPVGDSRCAQPPVPQPLVPKDKT